MRSTRSARAYDFHAISIASVTVRSQDHPPMAFDDFIAMLHEGTDGPRSLALVSCRQAVRKPEKEVN
jgi:hypothetical protein